MSCCGHHNHQDHQSEHHQHVSQQQTHTHETQPLKGQNDHKGMHQSKKK